MSIEKYVDENLADYYDFLRLKTVAAQNIGIRQTSKWLLEKFKQLGATRIEKWKNLGGNSVI